MTNQGKHIRKQIKSLYDLKTAFIARDANRTFTKPTKSIELLI